MMPEWTHLIRFEAVEDGKVYLGQLVYTDRDVGLDSLNGTEIKAFVLEGSVLDAKKTDRILTVKHLLAPITREQCNYIRCLGLNYTDHAAEGGFAIPTEIELFSKPRTALIGPYPEPVTIPRCAQDGTSDYEAELCVVIGKAARDVSEEDALDYVLGYTASNDISARTMQLATKQWCFGKGLDDSCPIGPVLVSPHAIPDPQKLKIQAVYNDKVLQNGHTKDMVFSIRKQISSLSRGTTLEAGSIILTGTPAGIGYFKQPRVFLEEGSQIKVYIDKIGSLVNYVKYE